MGLIGRILNGGAASIGGAISGVAETFRPNATRQMELEHDAFNASLSQHSAEFASGGSTWFDRFVNGLNRLPRPMLALGTLGLFVFAMWKPDAFASRMVGLDLVPDPLWWLLGAVVGFYFGARELHYRRAPAPRSTPHPGSRPVAPSRPTSPATSNPALEAYLRAKGDHK